MALSANDITKIGDMLDDRFRAYHETQKEICEAHKERTEEHRKAIFGNGTPGLRAEVTRLKVIAGIGAFLSGGAFVSAMPLLVKTVLERLAQ